MDPRKLADKIRPAFAASPDRRQLNTDLDALVAQIEELRAELEGGRHEGDKGLRREYQFALEVASSWRKAYVHAKERAEQLQQERDDLRRLLHGPDRVGQMWKRVESAERERAEEHQEKMNYMRWYYGAVDERNTAEAALRAAQTRADELEKAAIPVVNKLIDGSYGQYGQGVTVTKAEIDALRDVLAASPQAGDLSGLCRSLYPGGHGEDKTCYLPRGHEGRHEYWVEPDEAGEHQTQETT